MMYWIRHRRRVKALIVGLVLIEAVALVVTMVYLGRNHDEFAYDNPKFESEYILDEPLEADTIQYDVEQSGLFVFTEDIIP